MSDPRAQLHPADSYSSKVSETSATNIPSLPRGAMAPPSPIRIDTPPATPTHRLLEAEPSQVQFATYVPETPNEKPSSKAADPSTPSRALSNSQHWVPYPLRPWFCIPLILILFLGGIGLEVALRESKNRNGWHTTNDFGNQSSVWHYVYTLPPVALAAIIVAMWTWTDMEIKRLQPYVDLVRGDSPPQRSLLLDYTRHNNFLVWTTAASNRHWIVVVTSFMVILCLAFQPLAAALLVVRDTWVSLPDMTLNNLASIGLNQNSEFDDLTVFLTAAGFASASVLYNLPEPPFVHDQYTVAPFELPTNIIRNGTVLFANTTALKSDPGCQPVKVEMTQTPNGWSNTARLQDCTKTWEVDRNATALFGTDIPDCVSPASPYSPVIFWFFTYEPSAKSSATFCYPTFTLWDVNIQLNLASGNITKVTEIAPFSSYSRFSSLSGNITGPPLNGKALNGIRFNLTNPDRFVLQRLAATQLQMPAAVFQAARQSPEGLVGSFDADRFVQLSTKVYNTYLTRIASTVYFIRNNEPNNIAAKTVEKRLFLSEIATHLLAAAMFILALCAGAVQFFHFHERTHLRLQHEPGTIASAVSFGAQTGMGELLAGRQDPKEIKQVLQNKKFRIDTETMKIVMEGEEGYEWASSPMDRRRSVFAALQSRRSSRRYSTLDVFPRSPRSPKTPRSAGLRTVQEGADGV